MKNEWLCGYLNILFQLQKLYGIKWDVKMIRSSHYVKIMYVTKNIYFIVATTFVLNTEHLFNEMYLWVLIRK